METHRERFYAAVAEVLPAMPSIREALRLVSERGNGGAMSMAATARLGVDDGLSLADSLERGLHPPPADELAIIRAGEESGTLAERLSVLSLRLHSRSERRRQLLARLAYPAFLFHFAALVGGFVTGLGGKTSWAGPLFVVAAVDVALLLAAIFMNSSQFRRGAFAHFVLSLPVVGRIASLDDTERVTDVISALYGAGRPLPAACRTAANAARFEPHAARVAEAAERLFAGESPEIVFASLTFFDPDVRETLALSSPGGRLEAGLIAASSLARRRRDASADRALRGLAVAAYMGAAGYAVWTILSFWSGVYSALGTAPLPGSAAGSPSFFLI
jgi:type II secretory pathway component PulF